MFKKKIYISTLLLFSFLNFEFLKTSASKSCFNKGSSVGDIISCLLTKIGFSSSGPSEIEKFNSELDRKTVKTTIEQSSRDYNKLIKQMKTDKKRRGDLSDSEKVKFDELQSKNISAKAEYKNKYGVDDLNCEDLLDL